MSKKVKENTIKPNRLLLKKRASNPLEILQLIYRYPHSGSDGSVQPRVHRWFCKEPYIVVV
jgi:hypothetical protein